jgi:hypothetical protein
MRAIHLTELKDKAKGSKGALAKVVRQALEDKDLQLHAALKKCLEEAGFEVRINHHKPGRCEVAVVKVPKGAKPKSKKKVARGKVREETQLRDSLADGEELIAWSSSDCPESAMEYAMLGAVREGR